MKEKQGGRASKDEVDVDQLLPQLDPGIPCGKDQKKMKTIHT